MKKIFTLMLLFMSFSCFALTCEKAPATDNPEFCSKFKSIASCHCQVDGHLPASLCTDVGTIYNRMIAFYGTQQKACIFAATKGAPIRPDSVDQCMQDWDCYRLGTGKCLARCM
jgi:hypothetical protein